MMDFAFLNTRYIAWPWALALVLIVPALTIWMIGKARRVREKRLARLGAPAMIARLAPITAAASRWQPIRLGLAVLLMAGAFTGPQWGSEQTVVRRAGIDVVLALDASSSMLARDEAPDRLNKMKTVVARLRELSRNDRFALVAFAGRSYVLSPVTVDDAALNLFLENLDPSVVGQSGSSIAGAIRQSVNLLAVSKSQAERAIVVMSDGEGFEEAEEVESEARRAGEMGITLITVGFGTTTGATIPVIRNGVVTPKRDQSGSVVISRHSPDLLRAAAETGRGVFVPPTAPDRAATARATLARLRTEQRSTSSGTTLAQRFQLLLLPALVLLVLDTLVVARRGRRRGTSAVSTAAKTAVLVFFLSACNRSRVVDRPATELYNHATALIAKRDSVQVALQLFGRAEASRDPEVRYRAAFNGGFVHLRQGLDARGDSATLPLDSALAVYKRTLTTRPDDPDAKWNYELALRRNRSGGGGGGGGGGGADPQPQPDPADSNEQAPKPRPIPGMNEQRAEQLLNAMEAKEQDVQGRKQRRSVPQPPPGGRDW